MWWRAEKACLAADETVPTVTKRLDAQKIESMPDKVVAPTARCSSPQHAIGEHISGVILQDETIHQRSSQGIPMAEVLSRQGNPTRHQGR